MIAQLSIQAFDIAGMALNRNLTRVSIGAADVADIKKEALAHERLQQLLGITTAQDRLLPSPGGQFHSCRYG